MDKSDHDPYRSDADVAEGTHPVAMLSLVGGLVAIATAACCLLQPFIAAGTQGTAGLLATAAGAFTLFRVHQGRWHASNRIQGGIGLALGLVGLACAGLWILLMTRHGAMPFLDAPPRP